ncbi:peptide chain release factor N(5)-glutamine methyltransferase [Cohnella pontilimi]|uniref:Release factor glutamine methyltransferase n=1 Tax=Cohnella pontilimi TaxID=2564100 RepID=A0A4U0FAZ7_9BACL|nr:peptide chain release factor N(5)-glutamine methyltransferase [Cohnella pontilimi]TJY41870.1 peptide chain release factor N(5)-glutamine methyltransferase [Cohnella pontilimi]
MNSVSGHKTLQEVWRLGAERLSQAGVEEAAADAELLLLHLLGKSKAELLRDWREPFAAELEGAWEALLRRREAGEPVQYVTGEQYFYGRRFAVSPAVLVPRPETELLAEALLAAGDRLWPDSVDGGGGPTVLDVGTGSGALAVTLAAERPGWRVTASDLSPDALDVARGNAAAHGVDGRIWFVQGDLLKPFLAETEVEPIDILVSNPPYIPSGDVLGLQREVREFEPHLALDGGTDGLDPYRRMTADLRKLQKMPRVVAFEVGAGQADDVAELLRAAADWDDVGFVIDYAGIKRHVIAIR